MKFLDMSTAAKKIAFAFFLEEKDSNNREEIHSGELVGGGGGELLTV